MSIELNQHDMEPLKLTMPTHGAYTAEMIRAMQICGCGECQPGHAHAAMCAVHNMPAEPAGPCDCGLCS